MPALEPFNVQFNFIQYYMLDAALLLLSIVLLIFYIIHLVIKIIYQRVFKLKSKTE